MLWPYAPRPVDNELLSTYLCRIAAAHGATPLRFVGLHLGEHVWTRDLDRTPPLGLVEAVSRGAALPESLVSAMRPIAPTGWISCIGVYHRLRRRNGLRYCPICLKERGAFLRQWRCAWVTCCARHSVWLHDACPGCGAVLMPHRAAAPDRCWRCACDLKGALSCAAATSDVAWQARLTGAVEDGTWGADLLHAARLIERALLEQPAARRALLPQPIAQALEVTAPSLCRVQPAAAHSRLAEWLACGWPASFRSAAEYGNWTQQTFARFARCMPHLVQLECAKLRAGAEHARTKCRHPLRVQLGRLRRTKAEGWRCARAELLLAAAERLVRGHR